MALTDLQRKEKIQLAQDLERAKKLLGEEKEKVNELEAKLELKAVSAECQIDEVESFAHDTLAGALEKNAKQSEAIVDLKFLIAEEKREKEYLLQRTATLARRDQLQKASILTMTEEIEALTVKINEFGDHFSLLATRSTEMSSLHKEVEKREDAESSAHEKSRAEWVEEKKAMAERIATLETSWDTMKDAETIMKDKFVKTLTKHQEEWETEKAELKKQIEELVFEKEGIEVQVTEIADLLEREHLERTGKKFCEDPEEDVLEPPGAKKVMMYNQ